MSNYGTGFPGFKSAIEEVTEALGGSHTREAVAKLFSDSLTRAVQLRRGDKFPSYSAVTWTEATDLDFDKAREDTLWYLCRLREPVDATADWKGGKLEHRGETVVLTGGGYSMVVAMLSSHDEYCYKARDQVTKWRVFLTDDGKKLSEKEMRWSSSPTSTNAKSEPAGQKSLRKIVETFFKVKLVEPA